MPLPSDDITWPPVSMMQVYSKMSEWAAWYSGEPNRIIGVYASANASSTAPVPWYRFWSRNRLGQDGAQRALLHVPLAGDLAATSGALLFGEPARVRVRAAREDDACDPMMDPTTGLMMDPMTGMPAMHRSGVPLTPFLQKLDRAAPKPASPEDAAEARLLQIMEEGGVNARLVEAAESAAAMGGVYIYPVWDKDLRPFPLLGVAQSDMAVPEFRYGILTAVTFHRTVLTNGNRVLRHLERHEVQGAGESRRAVILNAYFQGTEDRLGLEVGLGVGDNVTGVPLAARVELPFQDLDVEYVPNMRPNRLWRASSFGVADIQGSEALLDSLDEVYASWMRDVRLAKARIIVPREYLRPDPENANTPSFDIDQEIYVPMDMEPGMAQDSRTMLAHQFAIRFLEHRETARDLVDHIVSNAGYSPMTIGPSSDSMSRGQTGTAQRISEHKTLLTLRRKASWWRPAVANTLYRMMLVDKEIFGQSTPAIRPTVEIADSIIDQPLTLAQTALALKTAESASIEVRVRLVNPDFSEAEVDAEVARIKDELKESAPASVTTGRFGDPVKGDQSSTGNLPMSGGSVAGGQPPANDPPASPPMAPNAD